jgi:hypothetical protein
MNTGSEAQNQNSFARVHSFFPIFYPNRAVSRGFRILQTLDCAELTDPWLKGKQNYGKVREKIKKLAV